MPIKRCQHIFSDGHGCGSPALRGESFCYYHHPTRPPVARERRGFRLTHPTDPISLQHALGQILHQLASNRLDPRRASLLIYGLQIASRNFS